MNHYSHSVLIASIFAFPVVNINQIAIAQETRIEVTTIYVDARRGTDSNEGTRNSPLKTITQALRQANGQTTISLAGGTYSEETGEVFPLVIKDAITLKGITHAQGQGVVIRGGGSFLSPTAAEQNVAIAAIKKASAVQGVMVTNPNSRGHGLWIESASPEVTHCTFTRNGNTGLSVNGNSKPLIQNSYFYNNSGNGLLVYGNSAPTVRNNLFESTGFGVSLVQQATVTLENNQFQGNRIGIILEGSSKGIMRENTIVSSQESGLVAIADSQVDLGSIGEPGNNLFRRNQKLDIQNLTPNTISATGTQVNGATQGQIDFNAEVATASPNRQLNSSIDSRLRANPLPKREPIANNTTPEADPPINQVETLPPPPPIGDRSDRSTQKELVFSAPDSQNNAVSGQIVTTINVDSASNSNLPSSSNNVRSLSDLLTNSNLGTPRYRVLVEVENKNQQQQIVNRHPEAFNTTYQGKSMLQIGAFSDRSLAETASRSLANLGFQSYILD